MPNAQNLKPGAYKLSKEEMAKGGRNSHKKMRERKLLRECLPELLQIEYDKKQGKKLGSEMLAAMLMKKAMNGDVKAFEVLRDTAGEKPVDKVMVADVEKTIIDEVEKMVKDESN